MKSEKQSLTVFLDEEENPRAILFYNKNRDRILYTTVKADEEQIVELLENKYTKI